METFLNAIVQGLLLGGVYALIALGVVVISKATKVFNIAHGNIMMMMAFFAWWLLTDLGLPLWAAAPLVAVFSVAVALILDRSVMRPLVGRPMLIPFVAMLLVGLVVKGVTVLWWGGEPRSMPEILPAGYFSLGEINVSWALLSSFLVATAMFVGFVLFFRYTKMGLAMRAVAERQVVSQSLGIDVRRVFAVSWIVGLLSAALGGILLASMFILDSTLGDFGMMRAMPVLLLGGIESVPGAFVGALIIGVVEILGGTYIDPHVTAFREVLPFVLMVAILMIRPNGLFGLKEIRRI
jgi:branched-chain amino acid transport system permease protein